jgi:hypothetical protein
LTKRPTFKWELYVLAGMATSRSETNALLKTLENDDNTEKTNGSTLSSLRHSLHQDNFILATDRPIFYDPKDPKVMYFLFRRGTGHIKYKVAIKGQQSSPLRHLFKPTSGERRRRRRRENGSRQQRKAEKADRKSPGDLIYGQFATPFFSLFCRRLLGRRLNRGNLSHGLS